VANITHRANDRAWIVAISTEGDTDPLDGTQTTPLHIVGAVISTLDQILPYSTHGLEMHLEVHDTSGSESDTTQS
jgi:hypothetical protein